MPSTMDDVELLNVDNVCRLCLTVDEPKSSIFQTEDSPTAVPLVTKIQACLSLQILTTDKVSTLICSSCINNVNQWYNYKEACFHSQDKLQKWLETHPQTTNPVVVNIKEEPVDIDYCEDNNKMYDSNSESNTHVTTNHVKSVGGKFDSKIETSRSGGGGGGGGVQIDKTFDLDKDKKELKSSQSSSSSSSKNEVNNKEEECKLDKQFDSVLIKNEPEDDEDTDCTIEIDSVSGTELLLNPMAIASKEERIMEADSTQKSNATTPNSRKKMKRGPHTHFRGTRAYKQKCKHCQIFLHSKQSYVKHMERFHSEDCENKEDLIKLTGVAAAAAAAASSADEEELIEDVEEELTSMENDAPLTEVQQNIISQLKTFSCYECQQTFNDRKHTLIHIRQHMPDLRPYTCIACLTQFRDRSMYKLHCSASFECAMKIALVIPKEGNEKYFTCNMCLRPMPNRKELLSHLSKHSDKQYEEMMSPTRSPPKLQPMAPLLSPKKEILPKSPSQMSKVIVGPYKNGDPAHNHPCNLCGMIYRYKPNLLRHHLICIRLSPEVRTCYRCVHCGMTFLVFKKFHNHITLDHKKKEFVCFDCNAKFKSPSDYLTHHDKHRKMAANQNKEVTGNQIMSPHRGQSPLKSWSDNEEARRSIDGQRYVCNLCGQDFTSRAKLASHKNLHLKVKIYSCVICRSMFSSAGALEIHMKDHGIEDPQERSANSSCVEYDRLDNRPQDVVVDTVNTSTVSDTGDRENICNICGKIFSNYPNLRRHFRNIHNDEKSRYTCIRCSVPFKTKEHYEHHMKIEHKTKVMLMCSQCPKTFSFKANLDLHYRSAHGDKPGNQECDICGKVFLEEASLKIHRSWHNRANSRFYTRSFLTNEIKPTVTPISPTEMNDNNLVGGSSPVRPARARKSFPNPPPTKPLNNDYQCQVCDSKFEDVVELRKHLWDVHCARNKPEKSFSVDELQCQLCTNIFPDQKSLKLHMDWHKANPILSDIQKQSFLCEICNKHYSSKKALTKHRKLHKANTTIKFQSLSRKSAQYLCNICRKIFSSNQSLQRHRMSFHNDLQSPRSQSFSSRRVSNDEYKYKKIDVEIRENTSKVFTSNVSSKKPVTCHSCKKTFPDMSVLYKHKQLIHKPRLTKMAGKTPIKECIPVQNADGRLSCNICDKQFWSMSNLKQHFTAKHRNHTKSRCTTASCNPSYSTISQSIKTEPSPHKATIICCKLCNRHVWSREEIAIHILSVHGTPYEPDNNTNFHRETDLTTYVVEGAVNATCPCCNIKYPNNRAMKIHYFKFHEASD
ncbi:PREDICTED: zinc finger protein 62-like [Polistes dominula]|uniref:Zinc finger protein 62-like n=1 Tax=Polistes dominula TaxID=743375 RepID=A0ABM1IIZ7_POLDO|nr:PREDICTED: zinc finger protein 62-like [Polistes dominula]